jgi:LPPG:FO 2-phospho-L-lactate transferase
MYDMKVVALAGGVGGAKLVDGLSKIINPGSLTVIVNTGDDFVHFGLQICPDLDTVCYTLAGMADPTKGWGLVNESWNVMESIGQMGGPIWFRLGDRDLGTHLERTRLLDKGLSLSQIVRHFCGIWGIDPLVLPMSDDLIPTRILTDEGEMGFQEYFVEHQCQPMVSGFHFEGAESARPVPGLLESIEMSELVIICPSNPWVSVDPILAVPGVWESILLGKSKNNVIAVSPIIGGEAVKGPAAKMYKEMGLQPSARSVAEHYGAQIRGGLLTGFILDSVDAYLENSILEMGIKTLVTSTLMKSSSDRINLADDVIAFAKSLELEESKR